MRKLFLIGSLFIFSCGKEDVKQVDNVDFSKLIGKIWKSDKQHYPYSYMQFFQGDSGLIRYRSLDPPDTIYTRKPFTWYGIKPDTLLMKDSGQITKYRVGVLNDTTFSFSYSNRVGTMYITK